MWLVGPEIWAAGSPSISWKVLSSTSSKLALGPQNQISAPRVSCEGCWTSPRGSDRPRRTRRTSQGRRDAGGYLQADGDDSVSAGVKAALWRLTVPTGSSSGTTHS